MNEGYEEGTRVFGRVVGFVSARYQAPEQQGLSDLQVAES